MEEKELNQQKIDVIFTLRIMLRYMRKYWALALILAAICVGVLSFYGYRSYTPVYEASVSFTVRVANPLYGQYNQYNNATAKQLHETFPYILRSAILQQRVAEYLGVPGIPTVSTSVLENSNIFTMRVRSSDPEWAYQVLQAVIACYPQVADYVVGATNLVVLDDSGVPTAPLYELNLTNSLILGVGAGVGIWLALMLLLTLSRRTIHNEDELRRTMNYPCLGIIPATKQNQGRKGCPLMHKDSGKFGFPESMRLLQMHLQKEMRTQDKQVVMVSGAIPGEGKTTIAVNLAIAFATKGSRVLLLDCDMYNPSVLRSMGIESQWTLKDYLAGKASSKDLLLKTSVRHLYCLAANADFKDAKTKSKIGRAHV